MPDFLIQAAVDRVTQLLPRVSSGAKASQASKLSYRAGLDSLNNNCRRHTPGGTHSDERISTTLPLKLIQRGTDKN